MNVTKEFLLHIIIILTTIEAIAKTYALTCWHINPLTAKKRTRWESLMSVILSFTNLALVIWVIGLN